MYIEIKIEEEEKKTMYLSMVPDLSS